LLTKDSKRRKGDFILHRQISFLARVKIPYSSYLKELDLRSQMRNTAIDKGIAQKTT